MNAFEKYLQRKKNIMVWLPKMLETRFQTVREYGHLMENHINKSNEFLMHRAYKEKVDASTFIGDPEMIVERLHQILVDNVDEISEYLADGEYDEDYYVLEGEIGQLKGLVFMRDPNKHDWNDGPIAASNIHIVLQKKRLENDFIIKTAYVF